MSHSPKTMNTLKKKPEFKIVFVGDSAVGKTSIIMRYHADSFTEDNQSTIGAAFVSKEVTTEHGDAVLHIWDTAGQERYRSLVPMYARNSTIAVVVFDTTDPDGFNSIPSWVERVREDVTDDCIIIIAGNKIDMKSRYNKKDAQEWISDNHYQYVEVSAKSGQGIDILFSHVVAALPKSKFLMNAQDTAPLIEEKESKRKCC